MKETFKNRAIENIEAAELLFQQGKFNASTNRAYYATFHAAISALYSLGIEPKIDHQTIQTLFADNFFNRRKLLSSKYKGYLADLQDKRNIADYRTGVGNKTAKAQLEYAKEIISLILGENK